MENTEYTTETTTENEYESQAQADGPVTHLSDDLEHHLIGLPARRLEEGPLLDLILDLDTYLARDWPQASVQVAAHLLARGAWFIVGNRDEDLATVVAKGGRPHRRYLLVDAFEVAYWTPASAAQDMHDLAAAADDPEPPNSAVAAVLQVVQQHAAPPADEVLELRGAYTCWCDEAHSPVARPISYHSSSHGAARAARRRNKLDPETKYQSGLRTEVLLCREAGLRALGL